MKNEDKQNTNKVKGKIKNILSYIPVAGDLQGIIDLYKDAKASPTIWKYRPDWFVSEFAWGSFKRWALSICAAIILASPFAFYDMQRYVSLRNKAEQIADTNHDKRLDNEEKRKFYSEVGMPFRGETEIVPTDSQFKKENLEDYIKKYEEIR